MAVKTIIHGTTNMYYHGGCRCEECKQAASDYQKGLYRERQRRKGLTVSEPRFRKPKGDFTGKGLLGHTLFVKMSYGKEIAFHVITVVDSCINSNTVYMITVCNDAGQESVIKAHEIERGVKDGLISIVRTPQEERLAVLERANNLPSLTDQEIDEQCVALLQQQKLCAA